MSFDINTAMLLGISLMNLIGILVTVFSAKKVQKDTAEIKVHTNSMKDALVGAEKELAGFRAVELKREEDARNAAERAKGVLQGQMTSAVETVIAENGKHNGHPAKVEVVNKDKPVPVKITAGAVESITAAVKDATKPRAPVQRKKAKRQTERGGPHVK